MTTRNGFRGWAMLRYENTLWRRLERWRVADRGSRGLFRTRSGLCVVTDPALVTEVLATRADDYLPQNPFFVVQRRGPVHPAVRARGLTELMRVLAGHRHPDDDTLLATCLGDRRSLALQGWGTRFLRRAYADVLARDRPPTVDAVVDRFVWVNLVERGIRGHRFRRGEASFRALIAQLAPELDRLTATHGDLVDVVNVLRGDVDALDRAEIYLRLVTSLLFATGVAVEWAVLLAAGGPAIPDDDHARAVVLEAQRLCPTAWGPVRTAVRPHRLGGERLRAGEEIMIANYLIHRSARHWTEPDAFRPQRMLGRRGRPDGTYQPFLFGPTACPARGFATRTLIRSVGAIHRGHRVTAAVAPGALPQVRFLLSPPRGTVELVPHAPR